MKFKIPRPLVTEHEELHEALVRATKVKGRVGEEQVLYPAAILVGEWVKARS